MMLSAITILLPDLDNNLLIFRQIEGAGHHLPAVRASPFSTVVREIGELEALNDLDSPEGAATELKCNSLDSTFNEACARQA